MARASSNTTIPNSTDINALLEAMKQVDKLYITVDAIVRHANKVNVRQAKAITRVNEVVSVIIKGLGAIMVELKQLPKSIKTQLKNFQDTAIPTLTAVFEVINFIKSNSKSAKHMDGTLGVILKVHKILTAITTTLFHLLLSPQALLLWNPATMAVVFIFRFITIAVFDSLRMLANTLKSIRIFSLFGRRRRKNLIEQIDFLIEIMRKIVRNSKLWTPAVLGKMIIADLCIFVLRHVFKNMRKLFFGVLSLGAMSPFMTLALKGIIWNMKWLGKFVTEFNKRFTKEKVEKFSKNLDILIKPLKGTSDIIIALAGIKLALLGMAALVMTGLSTIFMGAFVLFNFINSKFNVPDTMSVAGNIIAILGSFAAMEVIVKLLGKMNLEEVWKPLLIILLMSLVFVGFVFLYKLIASKLNKDTSKEILVCIGSMILTLLGMSLVFKLVELMFGESELGEILWSMTVLVGIVGLYVLIAKIFTKAEKNIKTGALVSVVLAGAILVFSIAIRLATLILSTITLPEVGIFAAMLLGVVGIFFAIGSIVSSGIGAAVILAGALLMVALGYTIKKIADSLKVVVECIKEMAGLKEEDIARAKTTTTGVAECLGTMVSKMATALKNVSMDDIYKVTKMTSLVIKPISRAIDLISRTAQLQVADEWNKMGIPTHYRKFDSKDAEDAIKVVESVAESLVKIATSFANMLKEDTNPGVKILTTRDFKKAMKNMSRMLDPISKVIDTVISISAAQIPTKWDEKTGKVLKYSKLDDTIVNTAMTQISLIADGFIKIAQKFLDLLNDETNPGVKLLTTRKFKKAMENLSLMVNPMATTLDMVQKLAALQIPDEWDPKTGKPIHYRELKTTDIDEGSKITLLADGVISISKQFIDVLDETTNPGVKLLTTRKFKKAMENLSLMVNPMNTTVDMIQKLATMQIPDEWDEQGNPTHYKKIDDTVIKTAGTNMQSIMDQIISAMTKIVDVDSSKIKALNEKKRIKAFENMANIINQYQSIAVDPAKSGALKDTIDNEIRFLDKISTIDTNALEKCRDLFKEMARFSESINGNFDKLADTLNEKIAKLVEDMANSLNSINIKAQGDGARKDYTQTLDSLGKQLDDLKQTLEGELIVKSASQSVYGDVQKVSF